MEVVLRVAFIYLFLLIALRAMGKREFSELSPMELVALLLIPEILSQGLIGEDFSITNAIIAVSTLLLLVFLNSLMTYSSERAEKFVESAPTVLAHDGRLVQANMDRERITPSEIYGELRKSGLERLDQVRWAVLESDGKISIVPAEQ